MSREGGRVLDPSIARQSSLLTATVSRSCSLVLPRMESAHKRFLPEVLQQENQRQLCPVSPVSTSLVQMNLQAIVETTHCS